MKTWMMLALALVLTTTAYAQKWEVDASHTSVQFALDHLSLSEVTGKFSGVNGAFTSPTDDFTQATGEVTIDVNTVNTENADRDKHLKAPDFFDVAKFPKMTFKAEKFRKAGGNKYVVEGKLTIRDVTKPVKLEGVFSGVRKDPWGGTRVGFMRFSTTINRKDFGLAMDTSSMLMGEEVRLTINTELVKK